MYFLRHGGLPKVQRSTAVRKKEPFSSQQASLTSCNAVLADALILRCDKCTHGAATNGSQGGIYSSGVVPAPESSHHAIDARSIDASLED